MLDAAATLETAHGSKYLQQLCKHFGHKIEVEYTDSRGECRFPYGTLEMDADGQRVRFSVKAPDMEKLKQMQRVVERHLATFAFRENIQTLPWSA